MRRRKKLQPLVVVAGLIIIGIFIFFLVVNVFQSRNYEKAVDSFYEYEQEGDFGSAWELFHPQMKKRFSKNAYVTERSHIYMSHYGVNTFTYKIVDDKKIKSWKMEKSKTFQNVHRFTIQQIFNSKFGVFKVEQEVFVVKEKGEWKIAWEFR
ncbi:hypothetical protein [Metabacillus arenae]|uniref:DUF4878 domain-containing protein n=1 Tax=Metabacillus arenae TaxID=2771434 RepID=A0A926NL26_9BACI|nr:hypothetical protein [Metabacillus arenae]MBD1383020.1 hypothetical protein [Metabacillus arenae]